MDIKNYTNLFHGSNKYIEDYLKPFTSFHYVPYVYATSDFFYALVRCGKFNPEKFLLKEDYTNDLFTLIELEENAFDKVFDTDGYIYITHGDFHHTEDCMENEYISKACCPIIETLYVLNVKEAILNNIHHYKIIKHDDEEYWKCVRGGKEGYLNRRRERIKRMRGTQ